MILETRKEKW